MMTVAVAHDDRSGRARSGRGWVTVAVVHDDHSGRP
jgi:hypothetical protein